MDYSDSELSDYSASSSGDSKSVTYAEQQKHIVSLLKGKTYSLPYLERTLEGWYTGVNPAYENVKAGQDAFLEHWVERRELREMAQKVDLSLCIACFFPRTSEDKLRVLFEKMAWFFAFDDDADSFLESDEFTDQEAAEFVRYWLDPNRSGPEPVVLPSCIIYRTCGPKLAAGMSEASKSQFTDTTIEYIDCVTTVAKQRETYLPSLEEYIEGRIVNIGVYPCLDLIPYAADIEISQEVLKHEAIQTIRYHVVRIVSLINDLFSVRKEIKDCQFDNIVPLLMVHKGMDVQAAADHTVSLVEESYRIVNEAMERLPSLEGQEKEHLDTYIEQCKDQATGSVHFHQNSPRYLPKSAFGESEITIQL